MTQESVPQSVAYDDNMRITSVVAPADAKSVAALATGDDLTYSLKKFTRTIAEAVIADPRLTLKQDLQKRGKKTETIEVQYIFGDDGDVAATACTEGTKLNVAVRYSVPNETGWTAAQVADILHIECGAQRKDEPVENGVQTITQTWYTIDVTETDAAIIA